MLDVCYVEEILRGDEQDQLARWRLASMNLSHKPLEVLLVEDSQEDIFFFKRALRASGIDVNLRVATDGRAAVGILEVRDAALPDLIFLDLKMPLMDGFDVLRWIRAQDFLPPLRIIVLSGSPHEKDQTLAAELGATEYLVKPINVDVLRSRLSQVMSI